MYNKEMSASLGWQLSFDGITSMKQLVKSYVENF